MKATHTPGPWRYQTGDKYTHIVRSGNRFLCQLAQDTSGVAESNARLMAAAPDLLAACEAAIRYDEKMMDVASTGQVDLRAAGGGIATGDDLDALYEDWMCKAREALKKARGE